MTNDFMMQVFLHLERDEDEQETNTVMENLSRSMLRNRAMSRSLSIPSKSTSYHSLQNEAATSTVTTDSEINTGIWFCFLSTPLWTTIVQFSCDIIVQYYLYYHMTLEWELI